MIGALGHDSAPQGYTGPGTTWANEMNVNINHALGAGSLAQPVDLQSSVLLCYGCPIFGMITRQYVNNDGV